MFLLSLSVHIVGGGNLLTGSSSQVLSQGNWGTQVSGSRFLPEEGVPCPCPDGEKGVGTLVKTSTWVPPPPPWPRQGYNPPPSPSQD